MENADNIIHKPKQQIDDGPFELGQVDSTHTAQPNLDRWANPGISGEMNTHSDDKIYESAYERLMQESAVDASNIGIKVDSGIVYLSGKVSNKQMKKIAEILVKNIPGVKVVRNELNIITETQHAIGPGSVTGKDLGIS